MRSVVVVVVVVVTAVIGGCAAAPHAFVEASDRTSYPAGPYGNSEGDVIADHGFVDDDGGVFALGDVFADPARRVLLLGTAAGWCGACVEEQPALQAVADERAALAVVTAVFEDDDGNAADEGEAAAWQDGVSFDVVADPGFVLAAYYDTTLTPMNMVIDVDTMTIVAVTTGFDEDLVVSLVDGVLADKGVE